MVRINVTLFVLVVLMALGVVKAQYQARKLYNEMDGQHQLTRQYMTEYDQLLIEQSTWAMHSRLEAFAASSLHMHTPTQAQTRVIRLLPPDMVKPQE